MRRPKKTSGASLDSLLDTMTNVVGILVILLTVTQLGVSDAVKRISASDNVKPEVLQEARVDLHDRQTHRATLARRLKTLSEDSTQDDEASLTQVDREIRRREKDVADLTQQQQAAAKDAKIQEQSKSKLQEQKAQEAELMTSLNASADELARLKALLEESRQGKSFAGRVVVLPDPRSAPEGTEPMVFVCREGRIWHVDSRGLQERAQKRVSFLLTRRGLTEIPEQGIDGTWLADQFNEVPVKDDQFEVTMTISGRMPRLVFRPREEIGETTAQLTRSNSQYSRLIERTDPGKHYLRFVVWPDSFETYLEARPIATKRGLMAGWDAQSTKGLYMENLAGKLRVGPPPKPKPPKPKPPETDSSESTKPDDGKPTTKKPDDPKTPKPRPKPKPADIID